MAKPLHPSVEKFKQFVRKHPKIIQEVRSGKKTWKEFYEDWYLFGEDDEIWKNYKQHQASMKHTEKSNRWIEKIANMLQNMDADEVQKYLANVQQAIVAIQSMIMQFQGSQEQPHTQQPGQNERPFSFRKD
ncbi:YlbD family protein [Parageobacillus thermoglucosidasius]|uniref:YlbD family protein n=1 Tax=Parageobacillus thermoglucosidasius TaxID=1426 RepID=UPI00242CF6C5|nr:YlbD family protein [Parageobacillus thermoglucosidasius]MBY6267746.1 cytosolic protein [Parageobacillus thermoglucosidasius]